MKKFAKLGAALVASTVAISLTVAVAPTATAAKCSKKTTVTMLGTIKPEIQDQFLAAVNSYNKSQTCYTLKSIPGDRNITFLQNVTPKYAAKDAPTISAAVTRGMRICHKISLLPGDMRADQKLSIWAAPT